MFKINLCNASGVNLFEVPVRIDPWRYFQEDANGNYEAGDYGRTFLPTIRAGAGTGPNSMKATTGTILTLKIAVPAAVIKDTKKIELEADTFGVALKPPVVGASNPIQPVASSTSRSTPQPPQPSTANIREPQQPSALNAQSLGRLTADQIKSWDFEKVRLAINVIYALHGTEFPKQDIQAWANQKPWYRRIPGRTPEIAEQSFSADDRTNIEILAARRAALKERR